MLGALSYHPIVHVHIGPLSISPHGVGIAVGFLLGARLMLPAAAAKGIPEEDVYPMLTWAAVGAIVGARVAYVLNHAGDYSSIVDVFKVWQGGISLLGGFFGAILLGLPVMYRRRHSFWRVMDAAAPGMALGVVIGRIGDLIVADHLGKTTSFFLGYRCPPLNVRTASPCGRLVNGIVVQTPGVVVHQTALYDLVLTLILLAVLLRVRRTPRYDGFLILLFGAWYSVDRIIEDFLRDDVRHLGLTGSQITSIVTLLACLYLLAVRRRTPSWGRWGAEAPVPAAAVPGVAGTDAAAEERIPAEVEAVAAAQPPGTTGPGPLPEPPPPVPPSPPLPPLPPSPPFPPPIPPIPPIPPPPAPEPPPAPPIPPPPAPEPPPAPPIPPPPAPEPPPAPPIPPPPPTEPPPEPPEPPPVPSIPPPPPAHPPPWGPPSGPPRVASEAEAQVAGDAPEPGGTGEPREQRPTMADGPDPDLPEE